MVTGFPLSSMKKSEVLDGLIAAILKEEESLDEIYKFYMLLHRSDPNISANFINLFWGFERWKCQFNFKKCNILKVRHDFR